MSVESSDNQRSFPVALTIAGSDPSGGAGIQADLKTFHQLGCYGMSVLTLLTVQNSVGVRRVEILGSDLVLEQFNAVMEDIPPNVIKTGALGTAAIIQTIAQSLAHVSIPIVIDPVMISKHGHSLIDDSAIDSFRTHLLPLATVVTPNRFEAQKLTSISIDSLENAATALDRLLEMGARNVVLKYGLQDQQRLTLFAGVDQPLQIIRTPNIESNSLHGTGCVLSAAIAAKIASGLPIPLAVAQSDAFVQRSIRTAPKVGHGYGPICFPQG